MFGFRIKVRNDRDEIGTAFGLAMTREGMVRGFFVELHRQICYNDGCVPEDK